MYVPTEPILFCDVEKQKGGASSYELWPANGSYVRTPTGRMVGKFKNKPALAYLCRIDGKSYYGNITDPLFVGRIMEYMALYYGKKYTNCSALAHFLATGEFRECEEENGLFVLTHGMQIYRRQKVRVGDMVCIVFANQKRLRSRTEAWRGYYMHAQKRRHMDGKFTNALRTTHSSFTAEQISLFIKDYRTDDYHFMVCIGMYNNQPVWISQWGRHRPGEDDVAITITIGNLDHYTDEVPLFTFIKRFR